MRGRWLIAALGAWAGLAAAQDLSGLARLDPAASAVTSDGDGLGITLALSQPVPWRLSTLDDPPRLVLELNEADWRGAAFAPVEHARVG
jgi:N-acetylmuramoyl-L-alanine amidase